MGQLDLAHVDLAGDGGTGERRTKLNQQLNPAKTLAKQLLLANQRINLSSLPVQE